MGLALSLSTLGLIPFGPIHIYIYPAGVANHAQIQSLLGVYRSCCQGLSTQCSCVARAHHGF